MTIFNSSPDANGYVSHVSQVLSSLYIFYNASVVVIVNFYISIN